MVSRRLALYLAADLSLAAAVAHALVAPEHFGEAFEYGVAFVVMALAQVAFIPLLFRWPSRTVYLLGIAGNAAIVLLYLYTRVIGIPFGPQAGEIEAVGLIDIPSKLSEVALIALLGALALGWVASDDAIPAPPDLAAAEA
jgi:hypothetical protein